MSDIEIEKGPALVGPEENPQHVLSQEEHDALDAARRRPVEPNSAKVMNVGDEEIAQQRAQNGDQAAQGEYEYGKSR